MRVMHDRVAAIDVHKDMVKVAVRVPGAKRGTRKTDVLEYRTFYGVLQEMGRELRRRGVTHVVMEASGVYTEPVYYALAELDFERGDGDQPGARQGAEGPQDRREGRDPAAGPVRVRAAVRLLHPGAGPEGGAGPGHGTG